MLFNSFDFLLFLPLVFILYWFLDLKKLKYQNLLVLIASYIFYGWWSWEFLGLLFLSTLLDYFYGFSVASANRNKAKLFLWLSIINNLGILAIFKYYNFFAAQFQQLFHSININVHPYFLDVALPIGISFYTFHGMSYVFDIYRQKQIPITNFIDYAVFVSFFPLLVAGPIERANHLLPQVQNKRVFSYIQAIEGCKLILWGLFKKVVIADNLAGMVNNIFENYSDFGPTTLILGAIGFSFQIYGDFSGYSDIAIGTAKLFGFELLSNFKFPYFSRDIAEFWRRWHISLSSWFRDYLYIPLGGSKEGLIKAVRNTFIIFIVSGFWHGASWNFIVWGFIHAMGFLPLLLMKKNRIYSSEVVAYQSAFPTLSEFFKMIATFIFVTLAWIFFRSPDLISSMSYVKHMILPVIDNPSALIEVPNFASMLVYIIPLIMIDWHLRKNERQLKASPNKVINYFIYIVITSMVAANMINAHYSNNSQEFIYFQF